MRIADFIRTDIEPILQHCLTFLARLSAQATQQNEPSDDLHTVMRDLLYALAADLDQPKIHKTSEPTDHLMSRLQAETAHAPAIKLSTPECNINQTVVALLALRTCILERWTQTADALDESERQELHHLNRTIDQTVTDTLTHYVAEKELHTRLFRTISLASPDPIYVLDLEGRFVFANKATQELCALPQDALIGKNAFHLTFPFAEGLHHHLQHVLNNKKAIRGELSHAFAPGYGERFEYLLAPVMDQNDEIEAVIGVSWDVTERRMAEEKIWHNANYDSLTGLPNRRLFFDRLDQEVKHATRTGLPLAVLFVDIDGFKDINNTLGHEAGDRLLCAVAERLKTCIRKADTVARLGGDEFTLVLTGLHESLDVGAVARKIIEALIVPFHVSEQAIRISASIGVTLCPQDSVTPKVLLRNADHAMYEAKLSGPNQIHFYAAAPR